jgi:Fe-S cluster biogenesis protein NfuA
MSNNVKLTAMPTPNPNSIKFLVEESLLERGSINFVDKEAAKGSYVAEELFNVPNIEGVLIGTNFISITKSDEAGWETVLEASSNIIKSCIGSGEALFDKALIKQAEAVSENDSASVKKIKEILDSEIRPAIAMDGGDCEFHSFEDGTLTLKLQGACSTCPSSVMTLKMGIENRLREDIPELKEVVQV